MNKRVFNALRKHAAGSDTLGKDIVMGLTHPLWAPAAGLGLSYFHGPKVGLGMAAGSAAGSALAGFSGWKLGDIVQRNREKKSKWINTLIALGLMPVGSIAGTYAGAKIGEKLS